MNLLFQRTWVWSPALIRQLINLSNSSPVESLRLLLDARDIIVMLTYTQPHIHSHIYTVTWWPTITYTVTYSHIVTCLHTVIYPYKVTCSQSHIHSHMLTQSHIHTQSHAYTQSHTHSYMFIHIHSHISTHSHIHIYIFLIKKKSAECLIFKYNDTHSIKHWDCH